MFAGTEHSQIQIPEEVSLADLVRSVLDSFAPDMPADAIAVYSYSQDLREAVLVASTAEHPHDQLRSAVETFCASGSPVAVVDGSQFPDLDVAWTQFLLFKIDDEPLGAMLLLSRSKPGKKARSHHRKHA